MLQRYSARSFNNFVIVSNPFKKLVRIRWRISSQGMGDIERRPHFVDWSASTYPPRPCCMGSPMGIFRGNDTRAHYPLSTDLNFEYFMNVVGDRGSYRRSLIWLREDPSYYISDCLEHRHSWWEWTPHSDCLNHKIWDRTFLVETRDFYWQLVLWVYANKNLAHITELKNKYADFDTRQRQITDRFTRLDSEI